MRYLSSASAQAGCSLKQLVADVVEVADQRDIDAHRGEPVADVRHGGRRLVAIDGDAHELRAGARERRDLARRRLDVGGVGVGHRLHRDRRAAADRDRAGAAPDAHADARAARRGPEGGLA